MQVDKTEPCPVTQTDEWMKNNLELKRSNWILYAVAKTHVIRANGEKMISTIQQRTKA